VCHSYSDLNFGVTFLEHSVCTIVGVGSNILPQVEVRKIWQAR